MKASSNAHLRRKLLCALVAGALAAPFAAQTAYALPIEGANAATNKTEADISTSGTVMDIAGKTEHNILKWEDFSIEQNEKVRFDGGEKTRDYLNLVTGEGASNIYGVSDGGRNVYLYGSPRPIPVVPLGIYRFSTARDLSIEGLRLE